MSAMAIVPMIARCFVMKVMAGTCDMMIGQSYSGALAKPTHSREWCKQHTAGVMHDLTHGIKSSACGIGRGESALPVIEEVAYPNASRLSSFSRKVHHCCDSLADPKVMATDQLRSA